MMVGESCSVEKEIEVTVATNAVYQDKTNILFSVWFPLLMCPCVVCHANLKHLLNYYVFSCFFE